METSYRELKCKYVVNIGDGKNLGKTCDIVFTFPEGRVIGIAVPGKSGIRLFRREDLFIPLRNIVKIGADVVLVDLKGAGAGKAGRQALPAGCGGRASATSHRAASPAPRLRARFGDFE